MLTLQKAMTLYGAVSKVNDVVSTEPVGELKVNDGTFWPVKYIIRPTFFVALIITVAGVILTQWVVLFGSVPVLLVTGFSWYWMKDLNLLKDLDGCLNVLVPIVTNIEKLTSVQKENLEEQQDISKKLQKTNKELKDEVVQFGQSTIKFEGIEKKLNEDINLQNETLKQRIEEVSRVAEQLKLTEQQFEEVKKINDNLQEQASKMEKENSQLTINLKKLDQELTELKKHTETLNVNANTIDKEEDKLKIEVDEISSNLDQLSEFNSGIKNKIEEKNDLEEWKKLGEKKDVSVQKLDEADDKIESAGNSVENAVNQFSKVEKKLDHMIEEETNDTNEMNNNLTELLEMMKKETNSDEE